MSKLTKFLKLFQYEPEADKQKTFNITEALNNNWDKVDAELEKWDADGVKYNLGVHQGKNVTIPNTKAGDYILPSIKGRTLVTKPNPNAEISPDNIATLQGVVNPVFTASNGKGNSNTSTLQAELYSLPNGVCDEYDGVSGKLTKQTHKLVFNGTENWETEVTSDGFRYFGCPTPIKAKVKPTGEEHTNGYCSHFKWCNTHDGISKGVNNVYIAAYGEGFYFYPLGITTVDAWKSYLASQAAAGTPVTVLYQLAKSIVTYPNIKLTSYNDTSTVSCNDTVLQNMSVTVADSRKVYSAVHSQMLDGKTPSWYIQSNPNLLINGDFLIAQRGSTFTNVTDYTYTADRWIIGTAGDGKPDVSVGDFEMSITSKSNSDKIALHQKIENGYLLYKGKTVTLSANIDGVRYSATMIAPIVLDKYEKWFYFREDVAVSIAADLNSTIYPVIEFHGNNKTWIISQVKLELGDHATPFVPLQASEDLSLCQRYFQSINRHRFPYAAFGYGVATSADVIQIDVPLSNCMRAAPVAKKQGNLEVYNANGRLQVSNITTDQVSSNLCRIFVNVTGGSLNVNQFYSLRADNDKNGNIYLDAEL